MQRVLIIGGNGSGKTTMARKLAEITGLPLCHLDSLYWTDGWKPREREEFLALLQAELERPSWILDGNMKSSLNKRLDYCDTVIYLDFSGIRCFFGAIKRVIQNRGKSRADMGGNCVERFDRRTWRFIFGTLKFNKIHRGLFYQAVAARPNVRLIVLKNRGQVKRFLQSIQKRTSLKKTEQ